MTRYSLTGTFEFARGGRVYEVPNGIVEPPVTLSRDILDKRDAASPSEQLIPEHLLGDERCLELQVVDAPLLFKRESKQRPPMPDEETANRCLCSHDLESGEQQRCVPDQPIGSVCL